jgi:DNA-binding winged helix-turn-helix (wHTH) protein/Tfp pilus assembly protein PilF
MLHRFGGFELDGNSLALRFEGRRVELPPKAVEVLTFLVSRADSVVTKADLLDALWPDGFIEEGNLSQHVYLLRRAFRARGFMNAIETYPRRGYCFHPPLSAPRRAWPLRRLAAVAAAVLAVVVVGQPKPSVPKPQIGTAALHAYTLGRYFWNLRSVDGMTRSLGYFHHVIALAPENALGYAALADAYIELADFERPCGQCQSWRRSAEEDAARAIALDSSSAEAHVAYGMTARVFNNDNVIAAKEFRTALNLDPTNALANQWYGNLLIAQGHVADGVQRLQAAAAQQPISTATYAWLARGYYYERRYADAERYARETLALEPTRLETNVLLGFVEESRGRFSDALTQFDRAEHLGASEADVRALRAGVYASMGQRSRALRMLQPLVENVGNGFYASRDAAIGLAIAGDASGAESAVAQLRYPTPIDRELTLQDPHVSGLSAVADAASTPESVVRAFYKWDLSIKYPDTWTSHVSGLKPFMTPSLYKLLGEIGPYEVKHQSELLDADPFIDAQIDASSAKVGVADTSGGSANVPVTIHYANSTDTGRVTVVLLKTANGWLIDDFVGARGGSLRKNLAANMK